MSSSSSIRQFLSHRPFTNSSKIVTSTSEEKKKLGLASLLTVAAFVGGGNNVALSDGDEKRYLPLSLSSALNSISSSLPSSLPSSLSSSLSSSLPSSSSDKINDDEDSIATALLEKYTPLLTQITTGSIAGFLAGYASKGIGRAVAFGAGTLFLTLQVAQSYGYLHINWSKIQDDTKKLADVDNDGKFTSKDVMVYWRKARGVMTGGLPCSTGFTLGFIYGVFQG